MNGEIKKEIKRLLLKNPIFSLTEDEAEIYTEIITSGVSVYEKAKKNMEG